jgi:hypothetical protein
MHIERFYIMRNLGASGLRPDRAFRSNSSDLPMQILRDFRFNPLRGEIFCS